ncbi:hypothetical protein [Wenxinia marina]|uniref:Uncharacterized protein n=1 Tax=Wenxinia marina DSM 24838 TaxID=1123501 RepID=A0A0D0NHT8_9RHOB|nr:hypothetical protein [Wenxinia marina]KIQ67915.1 hypothetical protein Wenmar_03646 [Wenxinia marina DSM 24838]
MDWTDVSQNWHAFVPRILTRWPELDGDDVDAVEGDRSALARLIAEAKPDDDALDADEEIGEWLEGEVPADVMTEEDVDNQRILASRSEMAADEDAYSQDGKFGDDDSPEPPVGVSEDDS